MYQVCAFIVWHFFNCSIHFHTPSGCVLKVCSLSYVHQWHQELLKHAFRLDSELIGLNQIELQAFFAAVVFHPFQLPRFELWESAAQAFLDNFYSFVAVCPIHPCFWKLKVMSRHQRKHRGGCLDFLLGPRLVNTWLSHDLLSLCRAWPPPLGRVA